MVTLHLLVREGGGSENCWDCVMFLGYVLSIVFHDFRNNTNLAKIIVDYV